MIFYVNINSIDKNDKSPLNPSTKSRKNIL